MTGRQDLIVSTTQKALTRPAVQQVDTQALDQTIAKPARIGLLLVAVFVFGFAIWAAIIPLAGGAVAPGIISPDGSRKTVQHLEGGIIGKLHVRDGDIVQAGQALLVLEGIQPRANYDLLLNQHRTLFVTRLRLEAEKAGADGLDFPESLQSGDAQLRSIMDAQLQLFNARRDSHRARGKVLRQRIEQTREQIKGFEAQVASATKQLEYIAEEVVGKKHLKEKGLLPKPELLRLQRAEAEIAGKRGEYAAAIARAQQQISESELQLLTLDAERTDQIATHYDQVRNELASVEEKLVASKDVLNRTVITAPVSGAVVNLRFKTLSGVVQGGEPILDIVPSEDVLLIDARISPVDIDIVKAGLPAEVRLTAFSGRSAPRVEGIVRTVSADRLVDEHSRQPYYLARIEIDRESVKQVPQRIKLIAGMPADVLIVTGERTLAQYMFEQITDALWRSFREV